jgi:hypothetical protein
VNLSWGAELNDREESAQEDFGDREGSVDCQVLKPLQGSPRGRTPSASAVRESDRDHCGGLEVHGRCPPQTNTLPKRPSARDCERASPRNSTWENLLKHDSELHRLRRDLRGRQSGLAAITELNVADTRKLGKQS